MIGKPRVFSVLFRKFLPVSLRECGRANVIGPSGLKQTEPTSGARRRDRSGGDTRNDSEKLARAWTKAERAGVDLFV